MEQVLTCNNLCCRQELRENALVTSCSHIFCMECAERLGMAAQETERRNTCPACHSQLNSPEDAVIINFNPSDEYKTTLMSGLRPSIIMDCAGRALSFWAYQTAQDIYYQQHRYRTLADKFSALNIQFEKTVSDANSEIDGLQQKLTGMAAEQDALQRKNDEIGQALKEKSRKVLQLQELYDKVKRKAELGQIQKAASDAVEITLEASQLNHGLEGDDPTQRVPENDNTPAFSQRRINGSGMNTGMPRSHANITREGTFWSRGGGTSCSEPTAPPLASFGRRGIGGAPIVRNIRPSTATDSAPPRNHFPGIGITSNIRVSQPDNTTGQNYRGRYF